MLHSMEGKFYVGSLEVHNPNPNPNHVPYWEGRGGGDIKFPLHNHGGGRLTRMLGVNTQEAMFKLAKIFLHQGGFSSCKIYLGGGLSL